MASSYDPAHISQAFDAYGDLEWGRHELSAMARVSFHLHRHYLRRFVLKGDLVLDVGAGAGRFTVELVNLGARVTVTDISPVQLQLNREHVAEAGLADRIDAWAEADVVDLVGFPDAHVQVVGAQGTVGPSRRRSGGCLGGELHIGRQRRDRRGVAL